MTLVTSGFDAEASFFKLVEAQTNLIQADLVAAGGLLQAGDSLTFIGQALPQTFPCVQGWFNAGAGNAVGNLFVSRAQISIYVRSPDPQTRDGRLLKLIRDTLTHNLGIRRRGVWTAYFDVNGHFVSPGSPQYQQQARLELAEPGTGWTVIPQPDSKISCVSRDFKIFYR